jgi:predicted nucleic acid-binding protein
MNEEIKTAYIFLDTSVFVKENFFAGNKLKAFINHSKDNNIKLITTTITLNECYANIEKYAEDSYNVIKKSIRELNNKAKILKNVELIEPIYKFGSDVIIEDEIESLKNRFLNQMKNNFIFIDIDNDSTGKIFLDYFERNPPFSEGKKKSEFPDAFVLNSLENWCKKFKKTTYIIADDKDFNSYKSDYLFPVKVYDKLLDSISHTYSESNILDKVDKYLEKYQSDFIEAIEDIFEFEFPYKGIDSNYNYKYDVQNLIIDEVYLDDTSILGVHENVVSIELMALVSYTINVEYEDNLNASWDKEKNMWQGGKFRSGTFEEEIEVSAQLQLNISLPGKDVVADWSIIPSLGGIPETIQIIL